MCLYRGFIQKKGKLRKSMRRRFLVVKEDRTFEYNLRSKVFMRPNPLKKSEPTPLKESKNLNHEFELDIYDVNAELRIYLFGHHKLLPNKQLGQVVLPLQNLLKGNPQTTEMGPTTYQCELLPMRGYIASEEADGLFTPLYASKIDPEHSGIEVDEMLYTCYQAQLLPHKSPAEPKFDGKLIKSNIGRLKIHFEVLGVFYLLQRQSIYYRLGIFPFIWYFWSLTCYHYGMVAFPWILLSLLFINGYGSLMFREHFYKHQQWWGDENFKEKTGAEKLQILLKLMKGLQTGLIN